LNINRLSQSIVIVKHTPKKYTINCELQTGQIIELPMKSLKGKKYLIIAFSKECIQLNLSKKGKN